jgi:hypothetical protein
VSGLWIWRGGSGRGRAVSVGALAPESVERLRRRGLALAGLTIAWNVVEGIVAVAAGVAAGSIALIGFGFDSTWKCSPPGDDDHGLARPREGGETP